MMATDIDIEEHDVLQDSKVMGIFPDLSLVKIEVLDDDEQDNTNQHLPTNPEAIPDSTTGYDSPLPFQRASESPHVVSSTQEDGTTLAPKIIGIQSTGNFFNNRIVLGQKSTTLAIVEDERIDKSQIEDAEMILPDKPQNLKGDIHDEMQVSDAAALESVSNRIVLGQKPSTVPHASVESDVDIDDEELMKCYSATVTLDDWGPYLNRSDSYCQECEILFPTVNALDAHKMIAHSFLVAVESKEPASSSKTFDPKKACFVCQKSFTNHTELIQHIYQHVSTTQECTECKETFLSKNLLTEHMKIHVKQEPGPGSRDPIYRCKICGQCHESLVSVKHHITKSHYKVNITSKDYVVVDSLQCATCGQSCQGIVALNAHFLEHQKSPKSKGTSHVKPLRSPGGMPQDGVVFVPKSTLFSCSECDTHFTSLSVAFSHKKSCPDTKTHNCQQCPLTVASACIERHRIQHMYGDVCNFTVINIDSENLTEKILCVCPKCEQHCSFQSIWNHVSSCPVTPSYHCPLCDIYVDKTTEMEHRFAHDAHRFSKDDFITIEYVTSDDLRVESNDEAATQNVIKVGKKRKLDDDTESQSSKRSKDEAFSVLEKEFIYCQNCRFFMPKTGVIKKKSHMEGVCDATIRRVCFTCGLVFTRYSIAKHNRLHENKDFTFESFKFFDLKSRPMNPPLPEYPQCRKCKCYYLQFRTAQKHSCPSKEAVQCTICNNKYSQMAYNLHMKFHGAKLSLNKATGRRHKTKLAQMAAAKDVRAKLIKSGKAVTTKLKDSQRPERPTKSFSLFYCFKCKCCYAGDSHKFQGINCAQSKAMVYRKRTCEVCGIIVITEKYKHHLQLHEKYKATLKDFKFFTMEKCRLLNPPIPSYYPCNRCKVHFHTRAESRRHDCESKAGHRCKVCKLKFSAKALRLHAPFHQIKAKVSPGDNIVYQCTRCTYVFSKIQASNRHSCLGPKKLSSHQSCSICHLKIHKGIYEQHLRDHDNMKIVLFNPKVRPPGPNEVTLHCANCEIGYDVEIGEKKKRSCPECRLKLTTKKTEAQLQVPNVPKAELGTPKRHVFYQCKYCSQAIRRRDSMKCHLKICGLKRKVLDQLSYCKICDLYFKEKHFHCHMKSHRQLPNLCKDTVTVIVCGKTQRKAFVTYNDANMTSGVDATAQKSTVPSKQYTLYQCRNCNGILSKVQRFRTHKCAEMEVVHLTNCPICKLNVLLSSYIFHLQVHSKHPDMIPKNIHIIPFGEKRGARSVVVDAEFAERSSSFVYKNPKKVAGDDSSSVEVEEVDEANEDLEKTNDSVEPTDPLGNDEGPQYTFYRCKKCLGCVTTEIKAEMHTKHQPNCTEMKKDRCKLCGIEFVKRFLRYHMDRHNSDPNFTRENMRIVNFGEASESPEPSSNEQFVLYQCAECLVCSEEKYEHLCENVERRTCDICHYDIEASYFSRHIECHKNDNYERDTIKILSMDSIVNVSDTEDDPLQLKKRKLDSALVTKKTVDVYKCTCGLHFLCRRSLEKHDFICQGVAKETRGLPCSKCHLVFDTSELLKHSISHHGNLSFDIKYNVIESDSKADHCTKCLTEFMKGEVCPNCVTPKRVVKKILSKKACPECGLAVSYTNFARHVACHFKSAQLSRCVTKANGNKVKNTNSSKTTIKNTAEGMTKTRRAIVPNNKDKYVTGMFKCNICRVHFMNENVYKSHKQAKKHVTPPKIRCKYCNVLVLQSDITQHSKYYHNALQSNVLFYCAKCPIHFFKHSSLQRHYYRRSGHEIIPSFPCPHCGLRFSKIGVKKHVYAHHVAQKCKLEDFVIKNGRNETIRGEEKDLDYVDDSGDGEEDFDSADEKPLNNFDDDASVDESKDTKEEIISVDDVEDTASVVSLTNTEDDPTDSEKTDLIAEALEKGKTSNGGTFEPSIPGFKRTHQGITYFKCTECNVHFLRYQNIQKHLISHRPMPEYDFLECKLCKLNFKVNSLRTHMDHHKNKNFTLDQVRFIEFNRKTKSNSQDEITPSPAVDIDKVIDEIKEETSTVSEEQCQRPSDASPSSKGQDDITPSPAVDIDKVIDEIKEETSTVSEEQCQRPSDASPSSKGILEQLLSQMKDES